MAEFKSWLKFFGLGFFSDKIAKQAARRGIFNFILGFALSLVFVFCGVLASNTLPFGTHYKNSSEFKSFVRSSFERTNLTVKDGKVGADEVVNTFSGQISAEGYKLVIDTRPSTAFDDFVAYYTLKTGGGEISYESYISLPEDEKDKYEFKIRYTPDELILTEELIAGYEEYLSAQEGDIFARFTSLTENKGGLSAAEYGESVYNLYLKAYYPDLSAYEGASAPRLRNYYYVNYLNNSDLTEYLFVFDDALIGNFRTDGGIEVSFYGVFDGIKDRTVDGGTADSFIKQAFGCALPLMSNVYAMNIFRLMFFVLLMPIILALISTFLLALLKTDNRYRKFTSCLKIQGSFLWFTGLASAFVVFVCGFFVSGSVISFLPLIMYFALLAARTALFIVREKIDKNKSGAETPVEEAQQ